MHMPIGDNLEINLLAANQHKADHNRESFDAWRLLSLNVMSSPGRARQPCWSDRCPSCPARCGWRCLRGT